MGQERKGLARGSERRGRREKEGEGKGEIRSKFVTECVVLTACGCVCAGVHKYVHVKSSNTSYTTQHAPLLCTLVAPSSPAPICDGADCADTGLLIECDSSTRASARES